MQYIKGPGYLIPETCLHILREFFAELNPENRLIFAHICNEELSVEESSDLFELLDFRQEDDERTSLTDE